MTFVYCQFGPPVRGVRTCEVCGRMVATTAERVSAHCRSAQKGPGTELKALLASLGIKASPTCKCNKMATQMDSWGPEESLRHIEEIVDVMQQTAADRGLPFLRAIGRKLVRVACGRARRKSVQSGQ